MPVTVVTTPKAPDATSYVSVADFEAWAAQRLRSLTGKTPDQLAVAVNTATEYMDSRFTFVGYREEATQALEWPRNQAWDNRGDRVEGVPKAVKDACYGYAFLALSQSLMPSPTQDESGRQVKSKSEKVGPIATDVEYSDKGGYDMPIFPEIDRLLYRHGLVVRRGGIGVGSVLRG
jgi:hypothetical protein